MRRTILTITTLLLLFCSGCAVFNRNNTPALNFVENHMVPKENPARAISYPLTIPLGFSAAVVDMLLLHPLSVAGDAWDDTNEFLWSKRGWDDKFVTTTVFNAPRAAIMPIVFTVDFLARSSFDISRRGGDIRLNKENKPEPVVNQKPDQKAAESSDALAPATFWVSL
ncbi:MAG: hypothetical protein HXX17_12105 [Geobacteraceae bacterium]|nr:hypothetical protein [Geobacteraceae bacterium]